MNHPSKTMRNREDMLSHYLLLSQHKVPSLLTVRLVLVETGRTAANKNGVANESALSGAVADIQVGQQRR
jgi:hypothetical protein